MKKFIDGQGAMLLKEAMDRAAFGQEEKPSEGPSWVALDQEEMPSREVMSEVVLASEEQEEEEIYSPRDAACFIMGGTIYPEALAKLDVEACHFVWRVDDEGEEHLISTGTASSTEPSTGVLVFSVDEMEKQREAGNKTILVVDHELLEKKDNGSKDFFKLADGLIILSHTDAETEDGSYDHFLVNNLSYPSVLLDNQTNPQLSKVEEKGRCGIKLSGVKDPLYEGQSVTIDPMTGRLWDKELPLIPPDENARKIVECIDPSASSMQVAVHVPQRGDIGLVNKLNILSKLGVDVGLYRTDVDCSKQLRKGGAHEAFRALSKGAVPLCLKDWDNHGFAMSWSTEYRLPDIHNMKDLLPPELREALDRGEDHEPGTPLFKVRETLYRHQLETAICKNAINFCENTNYAIFPSVTNAKEVEFFKTMLGEVVSDEVDYLKGLVDKVANEEVMHLENTIKGLERNVGFGVMMEIPEAFEEKEAWDIASMCDSLCLGTNGLTKEMTGLSRGTWDHSGYMKDEGLEGISPFDTFIPSIKNLITKFMDVVKKVEKKQNREILSNICGRQVSGGNPESVEEAWKMGVRRITVPAREENIYRAQLAIASYEAGLDSKSVPKMNFVPGLY